jgi:PAS domain S-box-containing protein
LSKPRPDFSGNRRDPVTTPVDRPDASYEGIALPVLVLDAESWEILSVNEAAVLQYGYDRDDFVGRSILEVRPPDGRDDARRVLSGMPHGEWKTSAVEHCRKDGSRFNADVWSKDVVVDGRDARVCVVNEVTERVELQRELQQAQKMETVGRLAGGIAHDFNNALGSVLGGADLLARQLEDDSEAARELEDIRRAAQRAASLTRRLLAFSRQQVLQPEVVQLAGVVEKVGAMLARGMEAGIEVRTRAAPSSGSARVDRTQLELVVLGLARNARDAMPDGGTLTLAAHDISLAGEEKVHGVTIPAGEYAALTVHDTGSGMDELTLARAFEPFYSTRSTRENVGLGLSMAHGIVRQSGGYITVDSAPERGTTFQILLPRTDGEEDVGRPGPDTDAANGPTVLLVDAEAELRRTTARVVEGLGAMVLSSASVEEAREAVSTSEADLDLLVLGADLGERRARDLVAELGRGRPALRVLFLSGYSPEFGEHAGLLDHGVGFLRKPYSVDSLRAIVRKMLSGG